MATPPAPFDRNSALRQFNQYFGTLQKQHGSAGLRNMGFMPRDLAALQASLRKLQLDPNSTPEQHQQAYQQARDTLAQRITTPQPVQAPPQAEIVVAPTRPAPPPQPGPYYAEYLASLSAKPAPEQPPLAVTLKRPVPTPMPTPVSPPPPPVPLYVDPQGPISVAPGGSANFNEATGVYTRPAGLLDALRNSMAPTGAAQSSPAFVGKNFTGSAPPPGMKWVETGEGLVPVPINEGATPAVPSGPALGSTLGSNFMPPTGATPPSTYGGIAGLLGGATPAAAPSMNTQAGADFDRNIFTRMLNDQFGQLRQKYGDAGLRSAGFTPRTLAELQSGLRKLQMDPNSTYDQNSAALEAALAKMNSYNFGAPAQPVATSTPMPMPQPVAAPTPMPQPVAAPTPMPTPVATPTPMPQPVTGMYRGGFAVKR